MFRMNGTSPAQGCAGAACFSIAQRKSDSISTETIWCFVRVAEATRYLSSGLVQARPVALDTRLPVSYGPEQRYRIPSAMCVVMGQWFLMDELH